ncbi:transcriptional adapter 2-alpha isoform X1 [Ovis aries]|uniref:Transcriptional adaptor 2A n=1 Tax=Ovis aries TaxID=9940 RepID=A0AC11ESZ6_SHEEP|nr:transcriptional adapter 2-alpha isoform X1 [Ovis aries]XP_060251161.1 transcriptional adapter 2-alpha isoform X1 [Ovis aries]XP_060251163.1 transcriptional adapter 2-alpha isoform X1 [Ovis aries]XP_060251164.1 transcriptional adapter 2-alpha isoform X1 [Ovis aries]XP_060251165.1 transcriptional adapter 2-alpha isoform X1 [Ovis aries]XP_060251166.1 transcriptional adapter 2-alpha isoform X1 [Ovis aries]XP_060251167.1 transcriptional adapter 2-alpha isoform X1 [Ovis aries]XP_060251168.1 tra
MDRLGSFSNDPSDKPPCRGCSSYLMEPYIKCAECGPPPFFLCLQCFTRGFEYKKHQSDHTYEIMTSDFPVLDPSWTAQEEMALLEAVMDCGFGNWQDVANQMCTKTKEECEKHYMKHFINNPLFASTLLNLKQAEEAKTADTAIPFHSADDPPRPTFDSLLSRDMAGYMPARADFIEEFDNYAEWDLRDIDFVEDDSDILHALKMAVVDIYHSRLKERQRRKKIIRDHGLINLRKFQLMERRYPKEVQDLYETMRRFARIVGPVEHDKFIESHALEFELRREIKRLQEYRTAGITNFCSARTYDHLKKTREEERLKRTMLSEVLQYIQDSSACQQWLRRQADIDSGLSPSVPMTSNSGNCFSGWSKSQLWSFHPGNYSDPTNPPAFVGARCLGKGLVIIIQIHKHQQVDRIFMAKQELSSGLHYKGRRRGPQTGVFSVLPMFTDSLFTMILSTTDLKIVSQGII